MHQGDTVQEIRNGGHLHRREPPDVFITIWGDSATEAEAALMFTELERFAQGKPWIFGINDCRRLAHVDPGARRQIKRLPVNVRGVTYIGASSAVRFMLNILLKAYRLIRRDADVAFAFHQNEEEARRWIEERRRSLGAPGGEGTSG